MNEPITDETAVNELNGRIGALVAEINSVSRCDAIRQLHDEAEALPAGVKGSVIAVETLDALYEMLPQLREAAELDEKITAINREPKDLPWAERVMELAQTVKSASEDVLMYCEQGETFASVSAAAEGIIRAEEVAREERKARRIAELEQALADVLDATRSPEICDAMIRLRDAIGEEPAELTEKLSRYGELCELCEDIEWVRAAADADLLVRNLGSEERNYAWAKRVLQCCGKLSEAGDKTAKYCGTLSELEGLRGDAEGIIAAEKDRADRLYRKAEEFYRTKNSAALCDFYESIYDELSTLPEGLWEAGYESSFKDIKANIPELRKAARIDGEIRALALAPANFDWALQVLAFDGDTEKKSPFCTEDRTLSALVEKAKGLVTMRDISEAQAIDAEILDFKTKTKDLAWAESVRDYGERLAAVPDKVKAHCKELGTYRELMRAAEGLFAEEEDRIKEEHRQAAYEWDARVEDVLYADSSFEKCERIRALKKDYDELDAQTREYCTKMTQLFLLHSNLDAIRAEALDSELNKDYRLANGGDPEAMLRVGKYYYDGDGVTKDGALAFKWFKKAAAKKNWEAMKYIGDCYNSGTGVKQSYTQAFKWYKKAKKAKK
ncbi:MAG: sel1 repeat family protein [Clostridia bacterium]|nr:sel1 repeat family protein [Clostridia bacterium]